MCKIPYQGGQNALRFLWLCSLPPVSPSSSSSRQVDRPAPRSGTGVADGPRSVVAACAQIVGPHVDDDRPTPNAVRSQQRNFRQQRALGDASFVHEDVAQVADVALGAVRRYEMNARRPSSVHFFFKKRSRAQFRAVHSKTILATHTNKETKMETLTRGFLRGSSPRGSSARRSTCKCSPRPSRRCTGGRAARACRAPTP